MTGSPEPRPERLVPIPRPRRWRWARWVLLSVGVPLVCYFTWTLIAREWTRRQGERELAETVADVERHEPNWRWEALNAARNRPPAGKNSADLIPRIKKLTHADWGKELVKDEWRERLELPPNVRHSAAILSQVRSELAASADAVKLARTLKDYPYGHRDIHLTPDVLNTLLEDTQHTRHAADLLRWDVVVAAEDGDPSRAADDLLAILNASRSIGDEPFLISQLVRMAVRTVAVRSTERLLAQSSDAPPLAGLQAAFALDAEEPLLLYGVLGDRAAFDRLFENLDTGATTPDKAIDSGFRDFWTRVGWWHYRAHLPADRAESLRWMTQCAEYARLPIHEQPAYFAALSAPEKDARRLLSGLLLPAVDRVAHAHWRTTAEARCAAAGIACERFRKEKGRWPDDLAELAPAFVSAAPLDPYTGEPLKYRKVDDGVVIPPARSCRHPSG